MDIVSSRFNLFFSILGQSIDFDVERAAGLQSVHRGDRIRVRNDCNRDDIAKNSRDRKRDTFDRDGALRSDVAAQAGGDGKAKAPIAYGFVGRVNGFERDQCADAIHMALHDVSAKRCAGGGRQLKVHDVAGLELRKLRPLHGLLGKISRELRMRNIKRGKANAGDGHGVAGVQPRS